MADIAVNTRSFSWAVDSAIRSESASEMGESRVRSFASVVDSAIRSSSATEADFEASPIRCFAFSSASTQRIVAARLSQAVSDGIGNVHARLFTLAELKAATNNFSLHNKIFGAGSISVVHRGKLFDGREVAIKRAETSSKMKEFQEVFSYLSTLLPGLHHNHLVGLVGFCKEKDKRFWVYEYMKNGALYDHLHGKRNVEKESSVLNSWRMRIKIALDASRGIEHLHKYVVPTIIHRDIKSCNILLDASWTARVSGFESSCFMSPEPENVYTDTSVLKAKSDVYGFGVVLLELLTGKKTTLKNGRNRGGSMVNVARRAILVGKMVEILDPRVGTPHVNEEAGLELVALTAINCVNVKKKDRPTMTEVVANLGTALSICNTSQ